MHSIIRASFSLFICLIVTNLPGFSQAMKLSENTTFTINGTSTLKSWSVSSKEVSGSLELGALSEGLLPKKGAEIKGFSLTIPVDKLDGGLAAMNSKMHKALKATTHKEITYQLTKASVSAIDPADKSFTLVTNGELNIAGKGLPLEMEVKGKKLEDGGYTFKGERVINMKDYDITPPTAMFGQIVAGEEVTVVFSMEFK